MRERFRPSDYRFLAICLALLAVTTWFSVRNFHKAFPEASIDFKVNRDGAREIAERFLASRGYKIADYRHASRFSFDENAKTFLEREAGLEEANRIMGSRVRLWRWSNRWFRPQQKEEFLADITPRGDVAGFEHQIPETEPRPAIPADEARAAAEAFLRAVMRRDPAALEFVEASSVTRPARTDHVFTWKEPGFSLEDAHNRIQVTVLGNEVGAYREYLKIPEQWLRDYQRLRSKNQAAQSIDTALTMALVVGLLVSLVVSIRNRQVRWRRAAVVGMIGAVLAFLADWNEFPLNEFYFPNTDSYASFVARQLLNSVLGALAAGGLLFVLTAAAEPLYREALGGHISLGNLFRAPALRTRSFLLGTVLGISLTGIFVAYQIGFYMLAHRFGAWSPADVPYSNLLNTKFPWAYVLFGGFLPAVSEEFLFRMFAVPYLRKVFRSLIAALIVAGFLWGFGHSGYPQQPFYIRGIEVGIGGVALGLIMLRWGILPALVWHYSVDAMYGALLLMRSDSLYFRLSGTAGAGIMLLPVAVALIMYWRHGGFAPEAGLTNADEQPAREPDTVTPAGEAPPAVASYSRSTTAVRIAALVVFACGAAAFLIPVPRLADAPQYKLDAARARAAADSFLRERGADSGAFRKVAYPDTQYDDDDGLSAKYLLDRRSVAQVANLFERHRPMHRWLVRYFNPLDREEYLVGVHPETGAPLGFVHTLPEDRPGATLTDDRARDLASAFARARGYDLSSMELKETRSEKRKARLDHMLVWEARSGDPRNVDEARFRLQLDVAGDAVSRWRTYWKIPEAFERARSQQNAVSIAAMVMKIGIYSLAVVLGLTALAIAVRKGTVRWRAVLRIAIPLTFLVAIGAALNYPLAWRTYNTAIPPETFQATLITAISMSLAFSFLMFAAMAAFIQVTRPESFASFGAKARRAMGVDAVLAVLAAIGLGALVARAHELAMAYFHSLALFEVQSPDLIASAAPALSAISGAARSVLLYCAALALVAHAFRIVKRPWAAAAMLAALAATAVPGEARTTGEFAFHFALGALALAAIVVFVRVFARRNPLAYALAAWTIALRGPTDVFLRQPSPALQLQGWLLAAVLAGTLAWTALPALRAHKSSQ